MFEMLKTLISVKVSSDMMHSNHAYVQPTKIWPDFSRCPSKSFDIPRSPERSTSQYYTPTPSMSILVTIVIVSPPSSSLRRVEGIWVASSIIFVCCM